MNEQTPEFETWPEPAEPIIEEEPQLPRSLSDAERWQLRVAMGKGPRSPREAAELGYPYEVVFEPKHKH